MKHYLLTGAAVSSLLLGACSDQTSQAKKAENKPTTVAGEQQTDSQSKTEASDTAKDPSVAAKEDKTVSKKNADKELSASKLSGNKLSGNKVIGLYQYMADAAVFTDCATGKSYPVAFEADNLQLERTYLSLVEQAGEKMMVELHAEFAMRPAMEGEDKEHLIPLKLVKFVHKDTCD